MTSNLEFSAVKGFGKFDLPHGTGFGVTDDDADIEASSLKHAIEIASEAHRGQVRERG